jgi:DNA-binding XRE family transcriptional regulator
MKTQLIQIFGENPFIKVMDFLLENYIFDYTKTEIAKEIGISRMTIEPIWQNLIKQKIILKTKKIGNATLFKLNTKNPIVIKLRELDLVLSNKIYIKEKDIIPIHA